MTNQHPITPPPELVQQWLATAVSKATPNETGTYVATDAARWGADQELEACCAWMVNHLFYSPTTSLLAARRPWPPSLKEQALARTDAILNDPNRALLVEVRETLELNRRALEQLDG